MMTDPASFEPRALEIIGALGADPARWPADERAAVLALAERPAVAAALAEARALDVLLADWSQTGSAPGIDAAAISALPQQHRSPVRRWYAAGGLALAASVALVLALPGGRPVPGPPVTPVAGRSEQPVRQAEAAPSAAPASGANSDTALFAAVFTPTADEEDLI